MLRKPTGIELSQLNRGSKVSGKRALREEGPPESHTNAAHRLGSKSHFQAESRAVDVDKHMYVTLLTQDGLYRVRDAQAEYERSR